MRPATLAIDLTALWGNKTTGIQRVTRAITPSLAKTAAQRGWSVQLVRAVPGGVTEIGRWDEEKSVDHILNDLDRIAGGRSLSQDAAYNNKFYQFLRNTARSLRASHFGRKQLAPIARRFRSTLPQTIRQSFRARRNRYSLCSSAADAFVSFSAGILPAMPPPGTPPDRSVFVLHDLIPLHHSQFFDPEITTSFARNISELAFSRYAAKGRFVTASQQAASEIDTLFYALSRRRVRIDLVDWGYDRLTFYRDADPGFRAQYGIPSDALLISAVSTQDLRKRFADIQAAVAELGAYAIFIGDGKPRREGNAIFLGYVADEVVRRAYSCSDVVVNWSCAEGFGLPTIEALACGARVVVPPDNPALLEVGGPNVHVAGSADPRALARAIVEAARQPRPHADLNRFDWKYSAEKIESLLWDAPFLRRSAA